MKYYLILSCSSELGNCCNDQGIAIVLDTLRRIAEIVQIVVPIILILAAAIEFSKLVMNPDDKKGLSRIKNMGIAAVVVFFIPMLANVILNMMPQSFSVSACWNQAKTMAESSRSQTFKYISPYKNKKSTSIISNPGDYEKGDEKKTDDGTGGSLAPGDAQGILEGAAKVHAMYEQNGWFYYSNLNQLRWNDVKYSTNNPSKATCCATFVGSAFLVGNVFPENVINKYNYNSQYGISELCEAQGWTKITSYSQLAAGDIVIMSGPEGGSAPGHVQIYAGNGTWYNAGSTNAIQRKNPYASDASARFLWAWRKPA